MSRRLAKTAAVLTVALASAACGDSTSDDLPQGAGPDPVDAADVAGGDARADLDPRPPEGDIAADGGDPSGSCTGVVCDSPPGPCLAPTGVCEAGACVYPPDDTLGCDDGDACTVLDRCVGGACVGSLAPCETPPPPTCLDDRTLLVHQAPGACQGGECAYASATSTCEQGCVEGACVGNVPPKVQLDCPDTVLATLEVIFDASASVDPDGEITGVAFAVDGEPVESEGLVLETVFAEGEEGEHEVEVRVTDDAGETVVESCTVTVQPLSPPVVTVVDPATDVVVYGGFFGAVLAAAEPAPGRTIEMARLLIDGIPVGMPDESPPYEFFLSVESDPPPTVRKISVEAVDSEGVSGVAPAVTLTIANEAPVAALSLSHSGPTSVLASAAASADAETKGAALEVRFDWQSDGAWDTGWSTDKSAEHAFPGPGSWTVSVEVRDLHGQTDEASATILIEESLVAEGPLLDAVWYGTVKVDADTWLEPSATLSVAPGTVVQLSPEATLDLSGGQLTFEGTPEAPIVLTSASATPSAGDWDRVRIGGQVGAPAVLSWVHVEFAAVGLEIVGPAQLTQLTALDNRIGLLVQHPEGKVALSGTSLEGNDEWGARISSAGEVLIEGASIGANGDGGLVVKNAAGEVTVVDSLIAGNGGVGVWLEGETHGVIAGSQIEGNAAEGVLVMAGGCGDASCLPQHLVTGNSIAGNATALHGVVVKADLVATNTQPSGLLESGGPAILRYEVSYNAIADASCCCAGGGEVLAGQGGPLLESLSAPAPPQWRPLPPGSGSVSSLALGVGGAGEDCEPRRVKLHRAYWRGPASAPIQLTAMVPTAGGSCPDTVATNQGFCAEGGPAIVVDASGNWWGAADPKGRWTESHPGAVDASSPLPGPPDL